MAILIAAILFGLGFSYLATQNTVGTTLQAGPYLFSGIPVYLVVLVSLLVGLLVAWMLSSVNWISHSMTVRGKDKEIRHSEATVADLQKRVHDLEVENSKLRGETTHLTNETHTDHSSETPRRGFFDRLRHTPAH